MVSKVIEYLVRGASIPEAPLILQKLALSVSGVYEFYGSGQGPWPVTSSNAEEWLPAENGVKLMAKDPSVIVFNGAKIAATPVKHSRPSTDDVPEEPVQNNPVLV
jgi:hypothetical protein